MHKGREAGLFSRWMNGWMDECMNECMNTWIDGSMNKLCIRVEKMNHLIDRLIYK